MPSVSQPIESKGDAVRVDFIPASPSYFTGNATFTDDLLALEEMARKTSALPRVPANDSPKRSWITLEHYRVMSNNPLARVSQLRKIINILSDLNRIDPVFQTEDVKLAMERYTRQVQQLNPESERRERVLDAYGRAYETGGRKSSKAQVWLVKAGEQGEEPVQDATGSSIIVNGVSLAEYFGRLQDRSSVMWPLVVTERMEHYRAWVRVKGGGNTGQADAVKLGIARALLVFEPDLKPLLRKGMYSFSSPRCHSDNFYQPVALLEILVLLNAKRRANQRYVLDLRGSLGKY